MKMRRTAEPADPRDKDRNVPVNERLFIVLNHNDTSKSFWLRKVSLLPSSLYCISIVLGRWYGKGAGSAGIEEWHLWDFSMVSFTHHQKTKFTMSLAFSGAIARGNDVEN